MAQTFIQDKIEADIEVYLLWVEKQMLRKNKLHKLGIMPTPDTPEYWEDENMLDNIQYKS